MKFSGTKLRNLKPLIGFVNPGAVIFVFSKYYVENV